MVATIVYFPATTAPDAAPPAAPGFEQETSTDGKHRAMERRNRFMGYQGKVKFRRSRHPQGIRHTRRSRCRKAAH
jgi:hypothetical protein